MENLASTAMNQILIMFFIIVIGAICYKVKLIDKEMNKRLSSLVLMLVNPVVIFVAYQREFEVSLLKGLLISIVLAVFTHLFAILVSHLFLRGKIQKEKLDIERFAVVYSNCGFMGIPLAGGIWGNEGVFYITAYLTIFNLLVWTHGLIVITGKRDKETLVKAFLSPSVMATIIGFLFFVARLQLPKVLYDTMKYIGDMNTPLAMLVSGVTIVQTNVMHLFGNFRIYYVSLLKLLLVPVILLFLYSLLNIPDVVLLTSVLAAACPTAVTINLFTIRYEKDYIYASEVFAMSTLLSMITIPMIMTIAKFVIP